jgi:hypothetical protein
MSNPNSKSSDILSDGTVKDILRPAKPEAWPDVEGRCTPPLRSFCTPLRIFATPLKSHAPPLGKISMIDKDIW